MSKPVKFVLFGNTGSGKSTLGNTFLGGEAFKTSDDVHSETKETISMKGYFLNQEVEVYDTPGLQDTEGLDAKYLYEMAIKIKNDKDIQAFVLVLNFHNPKLDSNVQRLFQFISNMYQGKKWYTHLVVVWTNYCSGLPENVKNTVPKKKEGLKRFINEVIEPNATEEELNAIPQYFIDSFEARQPGDHQEELKHLVAWISQLNSIQEDLGLIKEINPGFKEIKKEIRVTPNESQTKNILTITTITEERFKKIRYNGTYEYTEWIEVDRTVETKTLPPEPVGQPIIETRVRSMLLGKHINNQIRHSGGIFHEPSFEGDNFEMYVDITETRTHQTMNDDSTTSSEWKEVSRKLRD